MGKAKASKTRIISVTSGKGGVGKTLTTVNLALAARRMGHRVLILDGDLGLANVDVVLGLKARYNVKDVLDGHASLADIIIEGPLGTHLIPSGSGIASLTRLSYAQKQQLLDQTFALDGAYDVLLIDTGAGIAESVLHFNLAADQVVVVTTPEPHAMTDAYALIKVLAEHHSRMDLQLLVNQSRSPGEGLKVAERIAEVARRFLDIRVNHLGNVPHDPEVPLNVIRRRAASEQTAHTLAGQAWTQVARKLMGDVGGHKTESGKAQDLWQQLIQGGSPLRAQAGF